MIIRFNYADRKLDYKPKSNLKAMVANIFTTEQKLLKEINYVFCSDDYLLKINQSALNHDYYTDIITFPLHNKGEPIEAEIYISIDRVKDNAKTNSTTFSNEIARVIAHGSLHLCGYKDKLKKDILTMRSKELFYIENL